MAESDAVHREDLPPEWRDKVDEVVAHLVCLRGGGAFLSPTDGRLLVRWLEKGVPVAVVVAGLERVAARRRERRARTPLSLDAARRDVARLHDEWVRRVVAGGGVGGAAGEVLPTGGPVSAAPGGPGGPDGVEEQALRDLEAVLGRPWEGDADRADAAMAVVRRFQEQAWEAARPEWPSLMREAEDSLKDVKPWMEEGDWSLAVEEVARDRVRRRHPRLSATGVWDRLQRP